VGASANLEECAEHVTDMLKLYAYHASGPENLDHYANLTEYCRL